MGDKHVSAILPTQYGDIRVEFTSGTHCYAEGKRLALKRSVYLVELHLRAPALGARFEKERLSVCASGNPMRYISETGALVCAMVDNIVGAINVFAESNQSAVYLAERYDIEYQFRLNLEQQKELAEKKAGLVAYAHELRRRSSELVAHRKSLRGKGRK